MEKILLIICFIFTSLAVVAQQEKNDFKNDLGINVNQVLDLMIFRNIKDEERNQFPNQFSSITYRHFISEKTAIKLDFGVDQFNQMDSTFSSFSGFLVEEQKFKFYAFQFGFQKTVIDYKKLKLTLGVDWFWRHESQENSREETFFTGGGIIGIQEFKLIDHYKENNLGIRVPLGIQFHFNDQIFISSELSWELFQTFSKHKEEIVGREDTEEFRENPDIINMNIRPPLSLFIHYRF